tara:strand:- start:275 stop:490 length:216 start_codon:yes stop_codon:yes gene_type:complete
VRAKLRSKHFNGCFFHAFPNAPAIRRGEKYVKDVHYLTLVAEIRPETVGCVPAKVDCALNRTVVVEAKLIL